MRVKKLAIVHAHLTISPERAGVRPTLAYSLSPSPPYLFISIAPVHVLVSPFLFTSLSRIT